MSSLARSLLAVGAVAGTALALWAQQTPGERRSPTDAADRPAETRTAARNLDYYLISCLKWENEAVISLSKLAQQRSSNREIKAFAEAASKDHAEFQSSLAEIDPSAVRPAAGTSTAAPGEAGALPGRAPAREQPTERPQGQPGAARVAGPVTPDQLMQIRDEVATRCLATAQRELGQKEGAEFDKAYIGMQLGAHFKMVDELTVFKSHASPRLQTVLAKGIQTAEKHLEDAKQLCKQLESAKAPETARRPTAPERE